MLAAAEQVLAYGLPSQVVFRVRTAMFARWAHAKFVPLGGPERTLGWIATVDDITDRRRAESQLAHQATHDPLTKLPNRVLLEDRLRQACARLRRGADSVSVLFIDLDGFKSINDTLGHQAGDRVLVEVAQRVRRVVRDVDTVARFAGDEFVVVCEGIKENEIPYVVRRIARAVDQVLVDGWSRGARGSQHRCGDDVRPRHSPGRLVGPRGSGHVPQEALASSERLGTTGRSWCS